jgi:hypothetical protein
MKALEALGTIEQDEALVRLVYAEALHASGQEDAARTAILAARDRILARAKKLTAPDFDGASSKPSRLMHARCRWHVHLGSTWVPLCPLETRAGCAPRDHGRKQAHQRVCSNACCIARTLRCP